MPEGSVTFSDGSPAPGVVVASGSEVGSTDNDGRFRLEGDGSFTVLTRPAGWNAKPWFHPADERAVSFVLEAAPSETPSGFAQVTDLHLSTRSQASHMEVPDSIESVVEGISRLLEAFPDVSLVVATGDLTDTGLDEEYEMVAKSFAAVSAEVVAVPGNHDHMAGDPRFLVTQRGYGTNRGDFAAWERHFGPRWFSLDRGGLHLVVVDWHAWELGVDREVQEQWVLADLATHQQVPWALFSHDQMPEEFLEGCAGRRLPSPVIGIRREP